MTAQNHTPNPDDGQGTNDSPTRSTIDEGILGFSIGYPGRKGIVTILIGGFLALFSWLIIPAFIIAGYLVAVTRSAGNAATEPPEFDEWGNLLVDGLGLFIMFIPVVVVYGLVGFVTMEIHVLLYLVTMVVLVYPLPALYLNYAMNDGWLAMYDVSGLQTYVTSQTYAIGFLVYLFVINGIGVIVVTILFGLSLLTIIGWIILWPMIAFYWYGIDVALWGWVHNSIESP